jgi:AhpD family alkylhydroperoxidase
MDGSHYGAIPVREEIRSVHRGLWEHLRGAGTWWTGAERLTIAAEVRQAEDCGFCRSRKAALSPSAVAGEHQDYGALPRHVVEVIHRVRTDPARLSHSWFDGVLADGLEVPAYVELIGVVTMVTGIDYLARALGAAPFPLPDAVPGQPSRYLPASAKPGSAWVPMIAPEDASGPEADLYPPGGMVLNIVRALSLVPAEARALQTLSALHYLPVEQISDPTARRSLDRTQMELIAARVSALNQCFYCTSAHAALLRVSGAMMGTAVDVAAVNGASETDAGVEHGADLLAFTEAIMRGEPATMERERLREVLSPESFVEAAALIGAFNVVNRIADATGIPLDPVLAEMSKDVRQELGLARFASAANTVAR